MFGVKLKLWMETHLGKRRVKSEDNGFGGGEKIGVGVLSPSDSRQESKTDEENGSVSVSASASTSVLLGSFTQNLSSPDTGYSTDGYSPKNGYPALSTKSSSYALSSLLSMHLFKRSSPSIPIGSSREEFPTVQPKSTGEQQPQLQRCRTATVVKNEPKNQIMSVRKTNLVKEESSASPQTSTPLAASTKDIILEPADTHWNEFLQLHTKSRTKIKTNPWLSIPLKEKSNTTFENESPRPFQDNASVTSRYYRPSRREIPSCSRTPQGTPQLNRMSASTDSGQGTLDNHNQPKTCEVSSKTFSRPRDSFASSNSERETTPLMGYPEMKIVSSSTTSTATNTPTPISQSRLFNGQIRSRRESINDSKSEDGTTLVDLMGRFDESSYQKMVDKETDILSDWANTDEDVDEDLLTPRGPCSPEHTCPSVFIPFTLVDMTASPKNYAPSIPTEINFNLPTNCCESPPTILPDPYDTLLLSGKSNLGPHNVSRVSFFPPAPGLYSRDSILNRKKIYYSQPSRSTHSKIARGALGLLRKLFRKPSTGRRDRVRETVLPDCNFPTQVCNRLLPCSPAPSKSFLTPTPNSFRRKSEDSRPSSVQKGVKIDVIRLPSNEPNITPDLGSKWQERPGQVSHSGIEYPKSPHFDAAQHSPTPFLLHPTLKTPSPAMFAFHRNGTPGGGSILSSPLPTPNSKSNRVCGEPTRFPKTRLTSPSFNNYSPIHRLVVTSHQVPRGSNIRSESTSVRTGTGIRPQPNASPLCVQHGTTAYYASTSTPTGPFPVSRNPPYQYITSSNQSSPLLNNSKRPAPPPPPPPHMPKSVPFPPLRGIIKPPTTNTNHYYSTPQKKDYLGNGNGATGKSNNGGNSSTNNNGDRIYERVDGLDNSDDGDGEGGDYECDLSLASSSQPSQSQSQSQSHSQSQERSVERDRDRERKVHWPMSWGTSLSETETRILEADTDRKYRRLISQAEALLKEIAMESSVVVAQPHQQHNRKRSRFPLEDCPQSDPLQRKTYDCWALRRLQQELAGCCASPPVLHRSRVRLSQPATDLVHVPMVTHIPLVRNHSFHHAD